MRVVFLTQAFPPHPEVGALRARNLVDALLAAGHQVTVVAERVPGAHYDADGPVAGALRVVPVDVGKPFGRRLLAIAGAVRPTFPAPDAAPDRGAAQSSGILRRAVISLLSLPDTEQHLIRPFLRAGLGAVREGANLFYTSAPPFSMQVVGFFVRGRTDVPWVAEYRDPWNHPWTHRDGLQNSLLRKLDARMERMALRRADALVTVTKAAQDLLAGRLPAGQRGKMILARNGIPDWDAGMVSAAPQASDDRTPFILLHAGSLYMNRDPLAFLDGLSRFVRRRGLGPEAIQVHLIGRCREYKERSVASLVEERGLSAVVTIEDWAPHDQVRARMLQADGLLLFAQRQPLQVPNKLYEYLAAGRPVLAFVDRDGESARLLQELGGAEVVYDLEPARIDDALERLYLSRNAGTGGGHAGSREARIALSTSVQMRGLVAELEKRFRR